MWLAGLAFYDPKAKSHRVSVGTQEGVVRGPCECFGPLHTCVKAPLGLRAHTHTRTAATARVRVQKTDEQAELARKLSRAPAQDNGTHARTHIHICTPWGWLVLKLSSPLRRLAVCGGFGFCMRPQKLTVACLTWVEISGCRGTFSPQKMHQIPLLPARTPCGNPPHRLSHFDPPMSKHTSALIWRERGGEERESESADSSAPMGWGPSRDLYT